MVCVAITSDVGAYLSQLIRIRSRDGNFRFEFSPKADVAELLEKVRATLSCPSGLR